MEEAAGLSIQADLNIQADLSTEVAEAKLWGHRHNIRSPPSQTLAVL